MPEPDLRVELSRDAYRPGETLEGAFVIAGERPDDLTTVELSVLWRTEGKGDEDLGVVHYAAWARADGTLDALTNPHTFATTLPRTPLSYDGVLVKIGWRARVRVRWGDTGEAVCEAPFTLGAVREVVP